ncbi:Angiotensin-converting enzyme-like protein, partial [Leptotrombidium deliense]
SAWRNATSFAWKQFDDPLIRRWFKSLSILGKAALSPDKLREVRICTKCCNVITFNPFQHCYSIYTTCASRKLIFCENLNFKRDKQRLKEEIIFELLLFIIHLNEIIADMENVYSTAKICPFRINGGYSDGDKSNVTAQCNLTLEPDLQRIIGESRDYDELLHVWKAWRDKSGKKIRFVDTGELWRQYYESDEFQDDLERLWIQLKPLYDHLHAFVRRRLISLYGTNRIRSNGPIPAHLLGNMWAQTWRNLQDILTPFPEKPSIDVTSNMVKKNITAFDMFKVSEEFFTSLGLKAMPDDFWKRSIITKPENREIVCHASAWDFCNSKDVRIKQCTSINMRDLVVTHHEMGHIQYFLQYASQPYVFREGANPGFHEAVGDVLALSVSTPNHLQRISLLDEVANDEQGDLNYLMALALDKIAFLPSAYLMDLWRWKVFNGQIKENEMNEQWWAHRVKYQGVCAPIRRNESDFDAGAKYHIAANVPYIRYFVSYVVQFQFHKSLCEASGHKGALHKCDIYRSKEAGHLLSKTLEKGSSIRWQQAMRIITNGKSDRMDAGPLLEYFDPLFDYLKRNLKGEHIGWVHHENNVCP